MEASDVDAQYRKLARQKGLKSWLMVAVICLITTAVIILSIFPSITWGLTIKEAAELTKYTGCIDRAYQIAHIVCIVDGDTTHCSSIGKRNSMLDDFYKNPLGDIESDNDGELPNADAETELTDKQKALLNNWVLGDGILEGCPEMGVSKTIEADKHYKCLAEKLFHRGYYYKTIAFFSDNLTVTDTDLGYVEAALENIHNYYPNPTVEEQAIIRFCERRARKIHEQFELHGAK